MPEDDERLAAVRARIEAILDPDPAPAELALALRLLRSFAARTPGAVQQVTALLEDPAADPEALLERAHSLRGSAANIGAAGLAGLCAGVEDQARAGTVADPAGTAGRIRAEAAGAVRAVSAVAEEYAQRCPA
ncbi:Hpt domain-containing protein [Actinoplanes teichomyceticus]|uniref:Hpt domain-containing protein n=1 Tax=Actinoplanes teichomyceticus TaxID=1867 RepID=A0A561WL21_ACTTI|nr:Hpt domain-containing protein [Actinoplanes teichomyceticus]TWG24571.1 Hpt domain-containing protein [Actinoplanes teichomyceticus]GIF14767.1 hypothetical protein Ate01nite_47990 [Actinoplanes teichomyceticus]